MVSDVVVESLFIVGKPQQYLNRGMSRRITSVRRPVDRSGSCLNRSRVRQSNVIRIKKVSAILRTVECFLLLGQNNGEMCVY